MSQTEAKDGPESGHGSGTSSSGLDMQAVSIMGNFAETAENLVKQLLDAERVYSANFGPGSAVDPFSTTATPISKLVYSTLEYFCVLAPTGLHHFKLEILPVDLRPFQYALTELRDAVVRYVLLHKHVLYAFLAIFESRLHALAGHAWKDSDSAQNNMIAASAHIRNRLTVGPGVADAEKSQDLSLLVSIQFLAMATGLNCPLPDMEFHVRAMTTITKNLGPTEPGSVADWLVDGAASVRTLAAIKTGRISNASVDRGSVMFDPGRLAAMKEQLKAAHSADPAKGDTNSSEWTRHSYLQRQRPNVMLDNVYAPDLEILADASATLTFELGSGFELAMAHGNIDSRLTPVLSHILDNLTVAKYVWKWPERCSLDLSEHLCQNNRKTLYRLIGVDLGEELDIFNDERTTSRIFHVASLARCVKFALIMMLSCATYRLGRTSCQMNVPRLKAALLGLERSTYGIYAMIDQTVDEYINLDELHLWAAMTGHFASQGLEEERWFAAKARSIAGPRLGIQTYRGLHDVMSKYIYSWTVQELSLKMVTGTL